MVALLCSRRMWTCLLLLGSVGCFAYLDQQRDVDTHPQTSSGAGASVLYPSESARGFPQSPPSWGVPGAGAQPGTQSGSQSGSAAGAPGAAAPGAAPAPQPAQNGMVLLGGTNEDRESHKTVHSEPLYIKWLKLPFALVAYPFVKLHEVLAGDGEPGPQRSARRREPQTPQEVDAARERERLEALERELEQRAPAGRVGAGATSPSPPSPAPPSAGWSSAMGPGATPGSLSIAQELAALRHARESGAGALPSVSGAPAPRAAPEPVADRMLDRDGDGRPDHWLHRSDGFLVQEDFDDDGDGSPDRSVYYDPATRLLSRVEEDTDHDGRTDTWTHYDDGEIARRRADTDGDGLVDSWLFYHEGQLVRREVDSDGDGFRDQVGFYDAGRIRREEADRNADGLVDLTTEYDAEERVARRDEDRDGNGSIDVRSYYEQGRLARREILDEAAAPLQAGDARP